MLFRVIDCGAAQFHFRGQPPAVTAVRKVCDDPVSGLGGHIAADEGGYVLGTNVPICLKHGGGPLVLRCLQ